MISSFSGRAQNDPINCEQEGIKGRLKLIMGEKLAVGPTASFYELLATGVVKSVVFSFICFLLGWLGIMALDVLTPKIHEREKIGHDPKSVGIFLAGFFIYAGLVLHGVLTMPGVGGNFTLENILPARTLGLVGVGFLISLLVGAGILNIVDRLTPKIPFKSINKDPLATSFYFAGYLIFLGLITHAALVTTL